MHLMLQKIISIKGLKKNQQENLERKLQLIQTAKKKTIRIPKIGILQFLYLKNFREEWKAVGQVKIQEASLTEYGRVP